MEPIARRVALLVSYGFWPTVLGAARAPRRGPLMVAAAHPGPVDVALTSCAVPRPIEVVGNEYFLSLPLIRGAIRLRGFYPMKRAAFGDEANLVSLRRAADAIRSGRAVAIYPQGFSEKPGAGAARLAAMAGAPVLPVMMYAVTGPRTHQRALAILLRPMRPPADEPRARNAFRRRLEHKLRATGSLRTSKERQSIIDAVIDDASLWKRPLRVPRRIARVGRLSDAEVRRLGRRSRALSRGCRRLRCSVGDLRDPPGWREAALFAAVWAPAAAGIILCAPPLLLLKLLSRSITRPGTRRHARLHMGFLWSLPYGLLLALLHPALPAAALAGLCALGLYKPLRRRVSAIVRVRRHGARLAPLLGEIDAALADRR